MRTIALLRTVSAFAVLVVLHFALRPLLGWRASPDFLVIALLLVSTRVRPGTAAMVGFVIGILADTLALHVFGATALAMSLVGFVASWLKAEFFADDLSLNAFFFFLGKWAFDILYLLADPRAAGGEFFTQIFLWSPLAAAVTAFAGLLTLFLLKPTLRTSSA